MIYGKRPTNKIERLTLRASYIPKDARPILEHDNGSTLYTYELAGKYYAIAFWGTAAKPLFHYSYRTDEQRHARILEFRASVEHSVTRRAQDREKKAAWSNPLKVGDLLYTSWGYDQTNVEFYAVTKVSGRRVWIREIAADYESTGFMSGNTWPSIPIRFIGEEMMKTAQPSGERGVYIKISESQTAWQETGRAHCTTSYA